MDRVLLLAGSVLLLLFLAVMAVRTVFFSDTGPHPTAAGQGSDSTRNQTGKTQRVSVTATGDILLEEPLLNTFGREAGRTVSLTSIRCWPRMT